MKVIADTGVWSSFFRKDGARDSRVVRELARLIRADAVQMLGPIRQELLSGARPDEHFARLREYLRHYPNMRLDETDDENAAECYNRCRQKGVQGTATDLLICAVAVRHSLKIFTLDRDFESYSTVLPIRLHRIGSRGA